MMDNDKDSKNTRLADLPNSTQLSIQRDPVKIGEVTSLAGENKKYNKDPNLQRVSIMRDLL